MTTIYKYGSFLPRAVVDNADNDVQSVGIMREDIMSLDFNVVAPIDFQIGDYCYFFSKLYQINKLPDCVKNAERNYSYKLELESEMYDLGKTDYHFLNANNIFTDSTFDLRGTPRTFGDLIIFNLQRLYPLAGWKLGLVVDGDFKTITFQEQNCLQALQTIAKEFNTEYSFKDKTINIYQRQSSSGIVMQYGIDQPLLSLEVSDQDNSNFITRLYPYGSTKNLPPGYRNGAKQLTIGSGLSVEKNIALYRIFEKSVKFDGTNGLDEIYPHRTGTVTAVTDPFNFIDINIDFNVNAYLVPGVVAQVVFNSGLCSGYTFDINTFDNATKSFKINKDQQETSFDIPSVTLTPAIGDTYVIVNIAMPQSYIDKAEADLLQAGKDYLTQYAVPQRTYTGNCNPKWFRDNNPAINLGDTVKIIDAAMGINVLKRIISYKRNLANPFIMQFEFADTVPPQTTLVRLINGI